MLSTSTTSLDHPPRIIQTTTHNPQPKCRTRSEYYYIAREEFLKLKELLEEIDTSAVETAFKAWKSRYENRYVHLKSLTAPDKHLYVKTINRFTDYYRKKLSARLKHLDNIDWHLLLTLTIDPKLFYMQPVEQEYVAIKKAWNKLRTKLQKRYGRFSYICILEVTKAGRPHLHILISGITWIPHHELSEYWQKYGCGSVVFVQKIRKGCGGKIARRYVMKYVTKTLKDEDVRYASILFATNRRVFSLSRDLQVKKQSESDDLWMYCGVVDGHILMQYLRDKKLINPDDPPPLRVLIFANEDDYLNYAYLFA